MSTNAVHSKYIPNPEKYPELQGDAEGFELATIRAEDISIALETLIGNYSEPILAVIRELVINALDSHRDAGQDDSVEILLPTKESSTFEIIDHGLGLSATDMISVFTHPSASTKRNNNASTGELGIGAKAPFTVTDRFEVIGTQNGVRSTLVMARIGDQLMHKIVDVRQSDEPNGVHIIVPVDPEQITRWIDMAISVLYWLDKTSGPKQTSPDHVVITRVDQNRAWPNWTDDRPNNTRDTASVIPRFSHQSMVRMGQIAYHIPEDLANRICPVEKLLFLVPNKTLHIAPNREYIVDDRHNEQVLTELYAQWRTDLIGYQIALVQNTSLTALVRQRALCEIADLGMIKHIEVPDIITGYSHMKSVTNPRKTRINSSHTVWIHSPACSTGRKQATTPLDAYATSGQATNVEGATCHLRMPDESSDNWSFTRLPVVFVDRAELSDALWGKVSKWTAQEKVVAVVLDKQYWLDNRLKPIIRHWNMPPEKIAALENHPGIKIMDEDDVEWANVSDIRESTKTVRQKPKQVTLEDDIHVISGFSYNGYNRSERTDHTTMSGEQLVKRVMSMKKSRIVTGTTKAIREDMHRSDFRRETIFAISTGERVLDLVKKVVPASRILTIDQHLRSRDAYLLSTLTRAQARDVADASFDSKAYSILPRNRDIETLREILSDKATGLLDEMLELVSAHKKRIEKLSNSGFDFFNYTPLAQNTQWADDHSSYGELTTVMHVMGMIETNRMRTGSRGRSLAETSFSSLNIIAIAFEQIAASR